MATTRTSTRTSKANSGATTTEAKPQRKTKETSKRKAPASTEKTTKKQKTKAEKGNPQATNTKGGRRVLPKTEKEKTKPAKPKTTRTPKQKFVLPPEAANLSKEMQGRVLRAMKQRMFVLSRKKHETDPSIEIFDVAGSVGNMYNVTIGNKIGCTCMDYNIKRTYCKHILMVLIKVYRLPLDDPMLKSLTTSRAQRLAIMQSEATADPSVFVPEEIQKKVMNIMYHQDTSSDSQAQRRPLDNNDCPICFEAFEENNIDGIDFCRVCGNNIHKECFQMWAASKGRQVTCVYCRSNWYANSKSEKSGKKSADELDNSHVNEMYYANFAAELGLKKKRETDTYGNRDFQTS
ncbi:hypothetical protein BD560DRAFT_410884 [Blakeslea trispora]|nr:hypothetical protein BD560DRAFT_410884 [Blakeslea trispora]